MTTPKSREPQYQIQWELIEEKGPVQMGPTAGQTWRSDPRRLGFLLARYKFVAKMLAGKKRVVEVGCGDGFGMRVVLQNVPHVHGVDFDPSFIAWAEEHAAKEGLACAFSCLDITEASPPGPFDAAYSLDLIEHLVPETEPRYWENVCAALEEDAVFIVGTPNVTASPYASKWSMEGHINLQGAEQLLGSMRRHFRNAFCFSMNDETVHTGFSPMAHYLLVMGVGKR